MSIGYLGLGSNVGDRLENINRAITLLAEEDRLEVIRCSSIYETEPVGEILDQRSFFNACLEIDTDLAPEELLDVCKSIEVTLGRNMDAVRHSPRPIDIDLLLLGDQVYESQRLVLPHREVTARRFVLVPLLELNPGIDIPGVGPGAAFLSEQSDGEDSVVPIKPPQPSTDRQAR